LDPEEAKKRAKAALAKVQLGRDPQAEKLEARISASVTLAVVAARYLAGYAKTRLKPKSFVGVARYLNQHWAPLAEVPVHKIGRADVAARLADIAKRNGPFAANRARAALSALYGWAIGEGLLTKILLSALARRQRRFRVIASFLRKSFARFGSLPVMANMAR
jgi:hypothetical protein